MMLFEQNCIIHSLSLFVPFNMSSCMVQSCVPSPHYRTPVLWCPHANADSACPHGKRTILIDSVPLLTSSSPLTTSVNGSWCVIISWEISQEKTCHHPYRRWEECAVHTLVRLLEGCVFTSHSSVSNIHGATWNPVFIWLLKAMETTSEVQKPP